jgi:hypothetical protein
MINKLAVLLFLVAGLANTGLAQEKSDDGAAQKTADPTSAQSDAGTAQKKSADDVARELANPNNSLASLTFKNQYRWYTGDLPGADDQDNYTLLFQPVFPFTLKPTASGGKANFFVRPGIPLLIKQPTFDADKGEFNGVSALGDIGFDVGYGVTEKTGLLWAFGMVGTLPTATDSDVAGKQLRLGPEALFAKFEKWGLYGIFPSHQWDVAGSGKKGDIAYSTSQLQLFFTVLPGGGWSLGSVPNMSYDWKSEEWTIPLNFNFGKTVMAGKTPVKLQFEINYYVEQADLFGPEWMISFSVTPVVRNFVEGWIRGN